MLLGEYECDYETAYIMENGKLPPLKKRCIHGEVEIRSAIERDWNELDEEYVCWRGWRIGNLDWIQ